MRRLPITEAPHPAGSDLERLSTPRLLARLHAGDREAARAVGRALGPLGSLVDSAAQALRDGGRLVYAGAGTSGRLGALDAAECPPTFGVDPSRVVALVAGGTRALVRSVEGAEDDRAAGEAAVRRARLGPGDLLVGISASGGTRFVLGALSAARSRGARTALVTSNPAARAAVDHRVVLDTGPERIAGSTRMKAGTAVKMALSLLSTSAFVRLGAVREGRMIALRPVSEKLRQRAARNVQILAGVSAPAARRLLDHTGWDVRRAIDAALLGEEEPEPAGGPFDSAPAPRALRSGRTASRSTVSVGGSRPFDSAPAPRALRSGRTASRSTVSVGGSTSGSRSGSRGDHR